MSTKNRINWNSKNNTLTRENLDKMSEDILRSASLDTLKESSLAFQNTLSTKEVKIGDTNTLYIDGGTRVEVYTMGKENLLTAPYEGGNGIFTDHLNPIPAGDYVFYAYSTNTAGSINFTFKHRRNNTETDPTDVDNLLIVTNGSVAYNTAYHFSAPNGIDFITTTKSDTTDVNLVLVREEDFTSVSDIALTAMDNKNLMPYPYQYDYEKSGYDIIVDGKTVKSGVDKFVTDTNSFIIDTIKFTDEGDGCILVERADPNVGTVNKEITLGFHWGTEMKLPAGTYTFGCKVYNAKSGTLWHPSSPKAYCRVLARWEDGNSKSYYNSSTTQKVTSNTSYTIDAYNGINSIICVIHIQDDVTDFAVNGLRFKPTLCKGNTEIEFTPYENRNIVYRYSKNLLRPSSPRFYSSANATHEERGFGDLQNEANGITVTKLGGGYYSLNGTATTFTTFQINIGRTYMSPIGTLRFGSLSADAPSGVRLRMTVGYKNGADSANGQPQLIYADAGVPGTFQSTADNPMMYYSNTQIRIDKGTVCNNVLIAWQLTTDDGSIETFDRFKMPVASAGYGPMIYDYYEQLNTTYVGNPAFNIAAKAWHPISTDEVEATLEAVENNVTNLQNSQITYGSGTTDIGAGATMDTDFYYVYE